jgi:hypothetical protein
MSDQEIETLRLEVRAGFAEVRLALVELRTELHTLGEAMKELWTEHLGHTHPEATS